jgi:hypothetical protein
MGSKNILLVCSLAWLCACGGGYDYDDASVLQKQGLLLKAAGQYRLFAEKNPKDPKAPAALFKAARIYARDLGLCAQAAPVFETLLKNYPAHFSRQAAMKDLFVCPDYFPADGPLVWTYGDSETGGANARQVVQVADWGSRGSRTLTKIYAGRTLVAAQKKNYRFGERDFIERQDGFDTIILKYPVEKGASWVSVAGGRKTRFTVEAAGLTIKVRAGEFENCVKVRRAMEGVPSWIYEYYAPWAGKVLTTVAGVNFENRVTELLSYENTQKK